MKAILIVLVIGLAGIAAIGCVERTVERTIPVTVIVVATATPIYQYPSGGGGSWGEGGCGSCAPLIAVTPTPTATPTQTPTPTAPLYVTATPTPAASPVVLTPCESLPDGPCYIVVTATPLAGGSRVCQNGGCWISTDGCGPFGGEGTWDSGIGYGGFSCWPCTDWGGDICDGLSPVPGWVTRS